MKLTLPWPPSMNTYWRRHGHIMHVSHAGKKFQRAVLAIVGERQGFGDSRVSVSVRAFPPDKRRRDIDNILKPLGDALTRAGLWGDDEQIDDLRIVRAEITKGGRVEVEIKPLTPSPEANQ